MVKAVFILTTFEPRGYSHIKETGMLFVSLRDVNLEFWSQFGCARHNAKILSREGLVKGCR